jgi:hypothetical protein
MRPNKEHFTSLKKLKNKPTSKEYPSSRLKSKRSTTNSPTS